MKGGKKEEVDREARFAPLDKTKTKEPRLSVESPDHDSIKPSPASRCMLSSLPTLALMGWQGWRRDSPVLQVDSPPAAQRPEKETVSTQRFSI